MSDEEYELSFLRTIARTGWTEETAEEFYGRYGNDIRRLVARYFHSLRLVHVRFDPEKATSLLEDRKLELFQNTISDVGFQLLDGLVAGFVKGKDSGRIQKPFLAYLAGTIKNLLIANAQELDLLPKQTILEVLRAFCSAKKASTRESYMALMKYRLRSESESELLSRCPKDCCGEVNRQLYHVVEYFFEVYIPRKCRLIMKKSNRRLLEPLFREFTKQDYCEGLSFVGSVTPYASWTARAASGVIPDDVPEDEALSRMASNEVRDTSKTLEWELIERQLVFWNRLLQGVSVSLEELDAELLSLSRAASRFARIRFVLLRSCASMAAGETDAMRRNLRVALLYWLSNWFDKVEGKRLKECESEGQNSCLGFREFIGRQLSWREAAELLGANPDDYSAYARLLKKLKQEFNRQWKEFFTDRSPGEATNGNK